MCRTHVYLASLTTCLLLAACQSQTIPDESAPQTPGDSTSAQPPADDSHDDPPASEPTPSSGDQASGDRASGDLESSDDSDTTDTSSSIDIAERLNEICADRSPCHEISRTTLDGPRTAGQVVVEIALHDLGESGRHPNEPCAPFEHWLLGPDESATLLLEACNDGYGSNRIGEDDIRIEGDLFTHWSSGGSSWRWSTTSVVDLSGPRVLEEQRNGFWTGGPNTERSIWNWENLTGFVHWKAPPCNEDERVYDPDLDLHDLQNTSAPTYRYAPLPQIELPADFAAETWKSTALGSCAIEVNAEAHSGDIHGQGFVVHGEPGDADENTNAYFRAIMGSPTELYVEITDPTPNLDSDSWLTQDHLEIWTADQTSYHDHCLDPSPASQWAISLDDGTVHAAHGSPDTDALQAEVHRSPDEPNLLRVRIEFTESPEALTVVYSDSFTGQRQDRMIATSDLTFGQAPTLGRVKTIESTEGRCTVNDQGALTYEDLRVFDGIDPL